MANDLRPIATPLRRRLHHIRYYVAPVIAWFACATLAGWLWVRHGGTPTATGAVNAVRISVNSKADGILVDLPRKVQVFDTVSAGEVLARIDSSHLQAQMARLQAQIEQLKAELDAVAPGAKGSTPTTAPAVALEATAGEDSADEVEPLPVLRTPTSLRLAIASREARIAEVVQRIQQNDIRAPMGGTIVEIQRWPGQAVQAGHAIMVIAADKGDYIVSYIRQNQPIQLKPGMAVDVRPRTSSAVVRSRVDSVGPQIEPVPEQQLVNPKIPEWGVPVHIVIPQGLNLRPGEPVDLLFHPSEARG